MPKNLIITQTRDYLLVKHRSLEKRLNLPPRPKRPLNAFMQFSKEWRPVLQLEYPKARVFDIMKMLSKKWAECDLTLKTEYRKRYQQHMIEYSREMLNYEKELTEEDKKRMKEETKIMVVTKEKKKIKDRLKKLGKPKKPPTTFLLFLNSQVPLKDPHVLFSRWACEQGKVWQKLDAESREKFEIESQKLMAQYRTELVQWEEKMIQQGHIDVIRRQVLLDLRETNLEDKTKKSEQNE